MKELPPFANNNSVEPSLEDKPGSEPLEPTNPNQPSVAPAETPAVEPMPETPVVAPSIDVPSPGGPANTPTSPSISPIG